MLIDLKVNTAGNLVDLHRLPDRAEGRFTGRWAAFMTMRHPNSDHSTTTPTVTVPETEATERTTTAPPQPWMTHRVAWFLAQFDLPAGIRFGMRLGPATRAATAGTLSAPDGSRVAVELADDHGVRRVSETGPTPLWEAVERAHRRWASWGEPDWPRFGVTITPGSRWTWLDDPDGPDTWPLDT